MAEKKPASVGEVLVDGVSSGVETPGTTTINPGNPQIAAVFGTEPVCPVIPGIVFPAAPNTAVFGVIADGVSSTIETIAERTKNPPSAKDILKEFSSSVTDSATKLQRIANTASNAIVAEAHEAAAKAHALRIGAQDTLQTALEAVESGAVDIAGLGIDVLQLPAAVLEGAFTGMKNAAECLVGAPNTPEAAFNKTSPKGSTGLADGRGASSILGEVATSTAKPVPVSDNPLPVAPWEDIA